MAFLNFCTETAAEAGQGGGWISIIIYVAFFAILIGFFYFSAIRPQKKEEAKRKALLETIAVGDSVVTTAGFYGVVINMIDDQGIVVDRKSVV